METHVIGATGRSGAALCASLRADGLAVVPVIRDPARWPGPEAPRRADLTDAPALRAALRDATRIATTAHARHLPAILAAAPASARIVALGSTRKFSRFPDAHGDGVRAGEAALLASGRDAVILHPTMIFGADGENNVRRLAAIMRRMPVLPLPGGGRNLVQPIHQSDVTRAVRSALARAWTPSALTLPGPDAVTYAAFCRAIAEAAGLTPPRIVPVPLWPLRLAARLPFSPVGADEVRRLAEDKAFDPAPAAAALGLAPIALTAGLRAMFSVCQSDL